MSQRALTAKSRYLSLCFGVLAILLSACATSRHDGSGHATLQGLAFTASVPRHNTTTEPVPLHLRLENHCSEEIGFVWWEKGLDILVSDSSGRAVARTEAGNRGVIPRFEVRVGGFRHYAG
jgi:hypothetical protein